MEAIKVERIHTENGSHIEPPLGESWTEMDKLRWQAGVVECDTGVSVQVFPAKTWRHRRQHYSLTIDGAGIGVLDFGAAWSVMTGVIMGRRSGIR